MPPNPPSRLNISTALTSDFTIAPECRFTEQNTVQAFGGNEPLVTKVVFRSHWHNVRQADVARPLVAATQLS